MDAEMKGCFPGSQVRALPRSDRAELSDHARERVQRLKSALAELRAGAFWERRLHWAQSHLQTRGQPEVLRTALAFANVLDNMAVEDMREAVKIAGGRVLLEASGNVSLAGVRRIAETGVDFISVGMLTHSVSAADISLKIG